MSAKLIATMKRKMGMSRDAFIRRCEDEHVPVVLDLLPASADYRRNYIITESDRAPAHLEDAQPLDFDMVTEYRFDTAADLADFERRLIDTEAGKRVAADEIVLFDRDCMEMFGVEEHSTGAELLMPRPKGQVSPPVVKMLAFIRARADLSRPEFIAGYENGHVYTALRLLRGHACPLFASYHRNYLTPAARGPFGTGDLAAPPGFDVMTEIGFWTQADWRIFLDLCARPEIGHELAEDEALIFDRASLRVVLSEEYRTAARA